MKRLIKPTGREMGKQRNRNTNFSFQTTSNYHSSFFTSISCNLILPSSLCTEKNKQNRVLKVICNTDHAMLSIIHTDITPHVVLTYTARNTSTLQVCAHVTPRVMHKSRQIKSHTNRYDLIITTGEWVETTQNDCPYTTRTQLHKTKKGANVYASLRV